MLSDCRRQHRYAHEMKKNIYGFRFDALLPHRISFFIPKKKPFRIHSLPLSLCVFMSTSVVCRCVCAVVTVRSWIRQRNTFHAQRNWSNVKYDSSQFEISNTFYGDRMNLQFVCWIWETFKKIVRIHDRKYWMFDLIMQPSLILDKLSLLLSKQLNQNAEEMKDCRE